MICFAWDGTAVARRDADASAVRSRVERLAALGVDIAVISSADVADVDDQLRARPGVEGRLFLYLSRGSEIYVVGPAGPRLLERREASSLEEEQLAATAEALLDRLTAAGLDVVLVKDHLNRQSIDLVPDWPEPPGTAVRRAAARGRGASARRPASPAACASAWSWRASSAARPASRTRPSRATSATSTSASPARATPCTR